MSIYENNDQDEEAVTHLTHEQYTEYKESCLHLLDLANKALKLAENPEFKSIVMEAYFDQEPKRLAGLMASGKQTPKQFNECSEDLRSIGSMRAFMQDFIQKGQIAQDELDSLEAAWNESVELGEV